MNGPQGGWHVELNALVFGLGDTVTLELALSTDDVVFASGTWFVVLRMDSPCQGQYPGIIAFINELALPENGDVSRVERLEGVPIRAVVVARSVNGHTASFEATFPGHLIPLADTGQFGR